MKRKEALKLVQENIKNRNLIKHCLAVESAMKAFARYFNQNEKEWGLTGLLHDIDYEQVNESPELHSKEGAKMLKELGLSEDICQAVLTHNEYHGIEPQTLMAKALFCADPLTGLIVAATLVLPSKKINDLKVESVLKRFKEPAFARNVNRNIIKKCEEYLNLSLEEFTNIALKAMREISEDLEL